MIRLSAVMLVQGELEKGCALVDEAVDGLVAQDRGEMPAVLSARYNVAVCMVRSDRPQEAEQYITSLIETSRRVLGRNHPETQRAEKLLSQMRAGRAPRSIVKP